MTERTGWIYVLLEPDENVIRYVGQTRRAGGPRARLRSHLGSAKQLSRDTGTHLQRWLRSHEEDVRVQILAELPVSQLDAAEIGWIALMKSYGCDLVNSTAGGTGGPTRKGMKTPRETAIKQGLAWVGRKHSAETRSKMVAVRDAERTYARSCVECRRVFHGYQAMRNHLPSHWKVRGQSCIKCHATYSTGNQMKRHQKSHLEVVQTDLSVIL